MADEPENIKESPQEAAPAPDFNSAQLLSELAPQGDNQIAELPPLDKINENFSNTKLLGGEFDPKMAAEAGKLAQSYPFSQRFLTKSA